MGRMNWHIVTQPGPSACPSAKRSSVAADIAQTCVNNDLFSGGTTMRSWGQSTQRDAGKMSLPVIGIIETARVRRYATPLNQ